MYNVRGKLLSGITSMHIDNSACVRVKGGESERFKIDSGVRQGCIISPWMFNIYIYGWIVGGSRSLHSCHSCFTCMYLECTHGLACPPSF